MNKTDSRRQMILAIVASETVRTQDDLVEALAARGVRVSQASVSRDIAALALAKGAGRYVAPDAAAAPEDPLRARIRENLLEVRPAGSNLLVLLTPPGEASGTALAIDRLDFPGVAGTVAGDDTIFIAVTSARAGKDIAQELKSQQHGVRS